MRLFRKRKKNCQEQLPLSAPIRMESLIQDPLLAREQLRHDLRSILGQGAGLRYLARLVAISGALGSSYSPSNQQATAYNEGLRRMGLFILAEVQENAPELMPQLLLLCLPGNVNLVAAGGEDDPLQ